MQRTIEVIVRETGSAWPEWLNHSDEDDRVVITGDESGTEGPEADLSFRVLRLLARANREGRRVRRAVVLVGTSAGNPYFDGRRRLARALVTHMAPGPGAELLFAAHATEEEQAKILSLVGALSDLLTGTHIAVAVRFDAPREDPVARSGVRSAQPEGPVRLRAVK